MSAPTSSEATGARTDLHMPISQTGFGTARVRMRRRTVIWLVGALLVIVVGVILTGGPVEDAYAPLDPTSPAPDGLAGVVELLEGEGVNVDITIDIPSDTSTNVFVPMDLPRQEDRDALRAFAERGGTLIVAGATALTHNLEAAGAPISDTFGGSAYPANCELLPDVDEIHHGNWDSMEVPANAESCFERDESAWLVHAPTGSGSIIALGSAAPFTNSWLAEEDNAVLAATLLGPSSGDRLVVLPLPTVGDGETPLVDLVPAGFWRGLILLAIALLVLAAWKGRRLGAPVAEQLPPVLPSAELARSVGQLYQRAGDRQDTANRLRAACRRTVAKGLSLAPDMPSQLLADQVTQRTEVVADDVQLALIDTPVNDDETLREVAAAVARVRREYRKPPTGATTAKQQPTPRT